MAGGPDNMPWPSQVRLRGGQMQVSTSMEDCGSPYLLAPWPVEGSGHVMCASATLMERATPYHLLLELARGKVNQVRSQAYDWQAQGITLPAELTQRIHHLTHQFGQAAISEPGEEAGRQAQPVLANAFQAAAQLVQVYMAQTMAARRDGGTRLDTDWIGRLGLAPPSAELTGPVKQAFHGVCVPLSWHVVEAEEATYDWQPYDALIDWAGKQGLALSAGPLVDFSSATLPAWLWLWEKDVASMAAFMCRFAESTVRRYADRIRRWQLTTAGNYASVLGLGEEELLGLTGRLVETVHAIDPGLELSIGIAQPWGEYLAAADRSHSPYLFADTLIRYGIHLAALDVEIVMAASPRGSYCRDLLDTSRMLDLYALLGVPLRVTLGYPSGNNPDPEADPELSVIAGTWDSGFSAQAQAQWARNFAALALCKARVQSVQWTHLLDAERHQFPHCGLVDAAGHVKPAFEELRQLRQKHLR
jgi:hypothetical protein